MTYDLLFKSGSVMKDVPEEFVLKAFLIPDVLEVRYHVTQYAIWQRPGMTVVEVLDNGGSRKMTYFDNDSEALEFAEKYADRAKKFYYRWGEFNYKEVVVYYHGRRSWSWNIDDFLASNSKEEQNII